MGADAELWGRTRRYGGPHGRCGALGRFPRAVGQIWECRGANLEAVGANFKGPGADFGGPRADVRSTGRIWEAPGHF